MSGEPEERRFDAGLVLAPLLATLLLSPSLLYPFGRDQGVFAYVGETLLRGGLPYRDVWEIKAPPIYLTYAAILCLGGAPEFVVHLVDVVIAAAAALGLSLLGRAAAGRAAGLAAAGWFAAFYFRGGFWNLAQAESFGSAALVAAAVAGWHVRRAPGSHAAVLLFLAGLATGTAAAYKITLALPGAFILLGSLWRAGRGESGQDRPRRGGLALAAATGFGLPLALMVGWMAATGCLGSFLAIQREFIPLYAALSPTGPRTGLVGGTTAYFGGMLLPLGLALVGMLPSRRKSRPASPVQQPADARDVERALRFLALGWLLAAFAGIAAQGKYFGYHWIPLLPPLALLAGLGTGAALGAIFRGARDVGWRAGLAVVLVVGWALASRWGQYASAARLLTHRLSPSAYLATFGPPGKRDFSALADRWAAAAIRARTKPEEPVFIWGFEPLVYFLADRRPPTRFAFSQALVFPGAPRAWREELLRDLRRDPPALFVVLREDSLPWANGTGRDSEGTLQEFPELLALVAEGYAAAGHVEHFTFYRRRAASAGGAPSRGGSPDGPRSPGRVSFPRTGGTGAVDG